jgi:hypothetical protein
VIVGRYDLDDLDDLNKCGYHARMSSQTGLPGNPELCDLLDDTAQVVSLLHDYGQDWQIDRQVSPAAWVAVRRYRPPVLEIHCALSIDELRVKLERATR